MYCTYTLLFIRILKNCGTRAFVCCRSNHSRCESAHASPFELSQLHSASRPFGARDGGRRQSFRTDIDLMREALDLIEMQRSAAPPGLPALGRRPKLRPQPRLPRP